MITALLYWSELESETYKESTSDKKRKIYIYKKADSELLKGEISSAWDKFQTSHPMTDLLNRTGTTLQA